MLKFSDYLLEYYSGDTAQKLFNVLKDNGYDCSYKPSDIKKELLNLKTRQKITGSEYDELSNEFF